MSWTYEDEEKERRFNEWMKKEIEENRLVSLQTFESRPKRMREKKWRKYIKRLNKETK